MTTGPIQTTMPFAEKMDIALADLCNNWRLEKSERFPIVVRCASEEFSTLDEAIAELGGRVRQHVALVGAVAAWVPLKALSALAAKSYVTALELEQEFSIA